MERNVQQVRWKGNWQGDCRDLKTACFGGLLIRSDVSSPDLNLHKHAKSRARRKAVTLCTGVFKGGQKKISLQGATPKLSITAELQKHLRDFNSETRGWGFGVHRGFTFTCATNVEPPCGSQLQNLWLKASAYVAMGTVWRQERCTKQVQSCSTTSTYLHISEKPISMATWAQLHKQIYRKSSTQTKHWMQQIHCCGTKVVRYINNDHSSKNLK